MKAIVYKNYGPPDVLQLKEVEKPTPNEAESGNFKRSVQLWESWFGPFHIHGSGRIIPPHYPLEGYANQVVFWQGHPNLLGTVWNDEQDLICDPIPLQFGETGIKIRFNVGPC